jgi:PiT family inorganic phosphate transporter
MVTGAPLLGTIVVSGWVKTLFFIVLAPVLGMALAYVLMISVFWLFRRSSPSYMDVWFRRLQLLSAALFSYSHGANDAQKTMGIMTGALLAGGFITEFHVQPWVVFAAHAAISLGTMTGGWRIVHTMGGKLTRLKPRGGFCAETAGAMAILFPTYLGIPVSTTHVITGAIAGVGSIQRPKAVRWKLAQNILWAWLMTLPASAAVAAVCYLVVRLFA